MIKIVFAQRSKLPTLIPQQRPRSRQLDQTRTPFHRRRKRNLITKYENQHQLYDVDTVEDGTMSEYLCCWLELHVLREVARRSVHRHSTSLLSSTSSSVLMLKGRYPFYSLAGSSGDSNTRDLCSGMKELIDFQDISKPPARLLERVKCSQRP